MFLKRLVVLLLCLVLYIFNVGFGFPDLSKIPGIGANKDSAHQGSEANIVQVEGAAYAEYPLKGVEMDLTVIDEMVTLLKLNDLMLHRLQVSADAVWPDNIAKEVGELPQIDQDYVLSRLKYDFSYMDMYAGEAFAITDLFSVTRAGQKIISKAAANLGKEVVYAKMVLGDQVNGRSSLPPKKIRKECGFFDNPVEDVLFTSMSNGGLDRFMQEKIDPKCMVHAVAINSNVYMNYKEAFDHLLPADILASYHDVESEIATLEEKKTAAEIKKINLEAESGKEKDVASEINILKKEISEIESMIKDNEKVKDKMLEKAKTLIVDEASNLEKVAVARKLKQISDRINSNLSISLPVSAAIVAKIMFDVKALAMSAGNPVGVSQALAVEMVRKGKFSSHEDAVKFTKDRISKILKRSAKLLPTLVQTTGSIVSQKRKLLFYGKYLDMMINAADKV